MEDVFKKSLSDAKAPRAFMRHFRKDEEGGMIIFSLFMFVLILALGGMAVDLMRFETTRAKLQGITDRATLAAADLDQTFTANEIVRSYFEKAGMENYLDGDPIVDDGLNYRIVTTNAEADMPTFFFDLPNFLLPDRGPGATFLTVSTTSTAEERVTDVEISLVLDVSGSMGSNNRITNLRPAAREFVTTVLENNTNAPQGLITISMVPYAATVNAGPDMEPYMGDLNRTHNYSNCPLLPTSLFTSTALNVSTDFEYVAHFDPAWGSNRGNPIQEPWCSTGYDNAIIPVTSDEERLHTAIDALEPYGNTAIDMGVKWAVALLDPSTRDMITGLSATAGSGVAPIAAGRPYDFSQSSVLKVIVVMTDGRNTQQYDLVEPYKSGLSYIWFNLDNADDPIQDVADNDISIQIKGLETLDDYSDDWFYIHNNRARQRWKNHPDGYRNNAEYAAAMIAGPIGIPELGRGPTYQNNVFRASWQDLLAVWEYNKIDDELLQNAYDAGRLPRSAGTAWTTGGVGPSVQINLPDFIDVDFVLNKSVVNSTLADERLANICSAAKANDVIIYTVAFEAPTQGQAALLNCASSDSHYFDVDGTDISAAFAAIATDIRALKLTR